MTAIKYYKEVIRVEFHRKHLRYWLNLSEETIAGLMESMRKNWEDNEKFQLNNRPFPNFEEPGGIDTLLDLTIAGDSQALYSLNIQNFCGQLALGTQSLLDAPRRFPKLLAKLIGETVREPGMLYDYTILLQGYSHFSREGIASDDEGYFQMEESKRITVAHNRIIAHIQRRIDSFQIRTANDWKKKMGISSQVVAMSLAITGSLLVANSGNFIIILLFSVLVGYLAGFLAGLFHDLISVVYSQKK